MPGGNCSVTVSPGFLGESLFPKFFLACAELFSEGFMKIRIVVKSAAQARLRDRNPCADHISRHGQSFFNDELKERQTRIRLELMRQIGFTDIAYFR